MKQLFTTLILLVCCTLALSAQTINIYKNNQIIATYSVSDIDSVVFKNPSITEPVILVGEFPFTTSNPKADIQTALNAHFGELQPYGEIGTVWESTDGTNRYKILLIPEQDLAKYQWYNINGLGMEVIWDSSMSNMFTFVGGNEDRVTINGIVYRVYGRYDNADFTYRYIVKMK